MAVSFVRIDDRMIHGQTVTRWAVEYPCDGIIAVNDAAASNPVLKSAYKSAAPDKKTFVWTMEHFLEKAQTVRDSETRYFLITKNPRRHEAEILVERGLCAGRRQDRHRGALQRPSRHHQAGQQPVHHAGGGRGPGGHLQKAGYAVDFRLIPDKEHRAPGTSSAGSSATPTSLPLRALTAGGPPGRARRVTGCRRPARGLYARERWFVW